MSEKLRLRSNGDCDVYVYIESDVGASFAAGGDTANAVFAINTSPTADVTPNGPTAQITLGPTANGDLTFRPNGTGDSYFDTGDVNLDAGNLNIVATNNAGTQGVIASGGNRIFLAPGTSNLFIGENAGTIPNVVNLDFNIGIGFESMNNLAAGADQNVALGSSTLQNVSGSGNVCLGEATGQAITTGDDNICIGGGAGVSIVTGGNNILIGQNAGSNYTGAESFNICIADSGTLGESGVFRVGDGSQTSTILDTGIYGTTPSGGSLEMLRMDSNGQIGTQGDADVGDILADTVRVNYTGPTSFTINGISTNADVIACDATVPNVLQYVANSLSNTAATGGRIVGTRARSGPTIVQNNDDLLQLFATGYDGTDYATAAQIGMCVDGVPGSDDMPGRIEFSTSQDGTQNLTLAMTIDSSQDVTVAAGDMIVSAGNITLPAPNAGGTQGVIEVDGIRVFTQQGAANGSIGIGQSALNLAETGTLNVGVGPLSLRDITTGHSNTAVGYATQAVQITGLRNVAIGRQALGAATDGDNNVAVGALALVTLNGATASHNVAVGYQCLDASTTGLQNTGVGWGALGAMTTGSYNTALGYDAGLSATGASGDNIYIRNVGAAESNTIRIGTQGTGNGQQDTAFMAGITSQTITGTTSKPVIVETTGQLGVAGNLNLPTTATDLSDGVITVNGIRFMHSRGTTNVFLGANAGNASFTVAGSENNVIIGSTAFDAMATNCRNNVIIGEDAMTAATDSRGNVMIGFVSGLAMLTQLANTAVGQNTLQSATTGDGLNTCIGTTALNAITTGSYNLACGQNAGASLTTSDSSNLCLLNAGTAGDNNTIRIGTQGTGNGQQDTTFVAGIHDVAVTNDGMVIIDSAGQLGSQINLVMPENPAFLAYNSVTDSNVTGAGTLYTVDFDTEVYDQGGDFAADTFTAPVTGKYLLTANVRVTDLTAAMDSGLIQIVTSNATYQCATFQSSAGALGSVIDMPGTIVADMDAADTAVIKVSWTNGVGDTADVLGTASPLYTRFSGVLVS